MIRKALRPAFLVSFFGVLSLPTLLLAQNAVSHVRVVRLSYISGTVALKRPGSTEWAKAQVNTPIQEGFELSTSANSYAEVEFENGSTARLGELSKVNFDQLAMDGDGNKLNRLAFEQGYATFHLLPEHHDAYSVKVAESSITPNGKSEFRTDLENGRERIEVFAGSIEVATGSKTAKVGKNKVLEFEPGTTEAALTTKPGIAKDSWDKWTAERDTQSQLALADQAVPARGAVYGWSDLDAYGEWGYFPGFGYGWSPFASAGWAPYGMGMWSFYPGMGYTWISGEPWGWMPYHYGNWNFSSGFGWFWMPGGSSEFSPALVSWYSGPGWIGWAPRGVMGNGGRRSVTAVPGSVVQNGLEVGSRNVSRVSMSAGSEISRLPFEPGAGARLPGQTLGAVPAATLSARGGSPHNLAPPTVLMVGNAAGEQSLSGGKHEPLRARMGTTLGGQYVVGGNVGVFRGNAFAGAHGPNSTNGPQGANLSRGSAAPTLLPHGQQVSSAPRGGGGESMHGGSGPSTQSQGSVNAMSSPSVGHASGASTGRH
jgi:hypothetical protein